MNKDSEQETKKDTPCQPVNKDIAEAYVLKYKKN